MRRIALAAALIASALALASCLLPPFDVGLSLAYSTASRMTLIADIGPLGFWSGEVGEGEAYYLPSQMAFATAPPYLSWAEHGLVVISGGSGIRVAAVDASFEGFGLWGQRDFLVESADPDRYNWRLFMLKQPSGGTSDYFVLHNRGAVDFSRSGLSSYEYTRLGVFSDDQPDVLWATLGVGPPDAVIGVSFTPLDDASSDQLSLLAVSGVTWTEYRFGVSVSGGTVQWTSAGSRVLPFWLVLPENNGFYQHDWVSGRSVLSWPAGKGYNVCVWDDSLAPRVLPINRRIDFLLSTGELYHRGKGSDVVYGWDGKKKYEFPVGDLRLVGERYIGGVATLVYTLAHWVEEDDEDQLYLKLYTIPTADLEKLDR